MRIALEFNPSHTEQCRARLGYAFSVFCAQYGHQPILSEGGADFYISYRAAANHGVRTCLQLSECYHARPSHLPAPEPMNFVRDGEKTFLYYAPINGIEPDWLAEIFEWLSCADEYSVVARDAAGRIPFEASYTGRHHLDPQIPYAAVAMRMLQRAICRIAPSCPEEPLPPIPGTGHLVINTHDVDFLPVNRSGDIARVVKNAVIALAQKVPALTRRPEFQVLLQCQPRPAEMIRALLAAIAGRTPADEIDILLRGELARNVEASYYFICAHHHRRDANYAIDDPRSLALMNSLVVAGQEVGIHGSYGSLDEPESLPGEYATLREFGFRPIGGRQHWLRLTLDRLIPALENSGASYDCSLGWFNVMGYRAGACFAFPLYNFTKERASTFLEIPLVMMEQCLCAEARPLETAKALLNSSRKYGWGGISVLWHPNAFTGGQLPTSIANVYWDLLDARHELHDEWVSAQKYLDKVKARYNNVGLLLPEDTTPQWQPQRDSIPA